MGEWLEQVFVYEDERLLNWDTDLEKGIKRAIRGFDALGLGGLSNEDADKAESPTNH